MSGPSSSEASLNGGDLGLATAPGRVARFFVGAGLPVFLLSAALVYELFLVGILLAPEGLPYWGGFARDFKVWCFSYDPRTGGMEWAAAWIMLLEPAFIGAIAFALWRRQLASLKSVPWRPAASGMIVGMAALSGLAFYTGGESEAVSTLPFPGEAIRTRLEAPRLAFEDQKGTSFSLAVRAGKVTLVTGVYAQCSTSCPEVLQMAKAVLDDLPEGLRGELGVVALSLNPDYDTRSLMDRVATGYGFEYPQFRYLNGDSEAVYADLQQMGFSRSLDERTGEVYHSNLFLLIDAEGRVAYRFGMGEQQRAWLREAAQGLLEEARG